MRLFYFKDPLGNFGDDINPWLWEKLLPNMFDEDESEIFVGIGTLINHKLPAEPIKHIFGSGVGYGEVPTIDNKYNFHAVRGYLSADKLGLSIDKVITDSAILVSSVYPKNTSIKKYKFGFMTTGETECNYDWSEICRSLGVKHISCHLPVVEALSLISSCETMISEAMHGAIVADSLGIPWIAVRCNENISEFKWNDWLSSVNMPYRPFDIPKLFGDNYFSNTDYVKNGIKRWLIKGKMWNKRWSNPPPLKSTDKNITDATEKIRYLFSVEPQLSSQLTRKLHLERYECLIDKINSERAV